MPALYVDTSALVRRYDPTEPGSAHVQALCASNAGNHLVIAQLAPVEMASALNRKLRERSLTTDERDLLWNQFQVHLRSSYRMVSFDVATLRRAERLIFRHPLRAYDATQLATALRVAPFIDDGRTGLRFCTADRIQAQAAEREGLEVELIE